MILLWTKGTCNQTSAHNYVWGLLLSISWNYSTDHWARERQRQKKEIHLSETNWLTSVWPAHDWQNSNEEVRNMPSKLNRKTQPIPAIPLYQYSVELQAYFFSDIFCFWKYNLLIRLASLCWVNSRFVCGQIGNTVEKRETVVKKYIEKLSGQSNYLQQLKRKPGLHLRKVAIRTGLWR